MELVHAPPHRSGIRGQEHAGRSRSGAWMSIPRDGSGAANTLLPPRVRLSFPPSPLAPSTADEVPSLSQRRRVHPAASAASTAAGMPILRKETILSAPPLLLA